MPATRSGDSMDAILMRRFLCVTIPLYSAVIFLLSSGTLAFAGRVSDDTDTFTGTAGTILPTYNSKWSESGWGGGFNDCEISTPTNGYVGPNGPCADYNTAVTWANDQYVKAKVGTTVSGLLHFSPGVRAQTTAPSSYLVDNAGDNSYQIIRMDNGTTTVLKTTSTIMATGDVVILEVVGTVLKLYVNTLSTPLTTYDTVNDSTTYASGKPVIRLSGTAGSQYLTAWEAGHFSGGAPSRLLLGVGQ